MLNAVVRTLWANKDERALWLVVPWPEEAGSGGGGNTARQRARQGVAARGTQTKAAILRKVCQVPSGELLGKRKRAEPAGPALEEEAEPAVRRADSGAMDVVTHLLEHDATQRLLVDAVASVDELTRALDGIYPALWGGRGGGSGSEGSTPEAGPPATLVLDGLDRLFLDADGQVLRRFGDSVSAAVQRLLYTVAQVSKEHSTRVYMVNGAVQTSGGGFRPVFSTAYGPALWGALRDNVDRTLWVTGDTVFALEDESQASAAQGGGAGRDELGLRGRVVEVHEGAKNAQWGVYASDGTVLYD